MVINGITHAGRYSDEKQTCKTHIAYKWLTFGSINLILPYLNPFHRIMQIPPHDRCSKCERIDRFYVALVVIFLSSGVLDLLCCCYDELECDWLITCPPSRIIPFCIPMSHFSFLHHKQTHPFTHSLFLFCGLHPPPVLLFCHSLVSVQLHPYLYFIIQTPFFLTLPCPHFSSLYLSFPLSVLLSS